VHWIKAEIHEYILRNWRIVKVATTKAQRKLFFNLRGAKKSLHWLNQGEADAVAKDLGVEVKDVLEMEMRLGARDSAFDIASDDDDDAAVITPAYYLSDPSADPEKIVENHERQSNNNERLASAVSSLDERSRDILQRRWLNDVKTTLQDLATHYSVSAERIRQLEKNAMQRVKALMEK